MNNDYWQQNIHALLKIKDKYLYIKIIIIILISLSFILFLFLFKMNCYLKLTGLVKCENNNCYINTTILSDDANYLQKGVQIKIFKVSETTIKDIIFLQPQISANNVITQEVKIFCNSGNLKHNQVINFSLKIKDETMFQMIWQSLKGGDE